MSGFYGVSLGCVTMILISTERIKEILIIAPPNFHWPDLMYLLAFIIGFSINCSISAGLTSTKHLIKELSTKINKTIPWVNTKSYLIYPLL